MDKCGLTETAGRYVDGELSKSAVKEYERHIETCVPCADAVKELMMLRKVFERKEPVFPSEDVNENILNAVIRKSIVTDEEGIINYFSLISRKMLPVAASLMLALMGLAFYVINSSTKVDILMCKQTLIADFIEAGPKVYHSDTEDVSGILPLSSGEKRIIASEDESALIGYYFIFGGG